MILVASAFHQPRAFLTFLKAIENSKIKLQIFNAPCKDYPQKLDLFNLELKKIKEYQIKGHVAKKWN